MKSARLRRGVHVGFVCAAVMMGLIATTWGGGAAAAALDQWGEHEATAEVLSVHAHEYPNFVSIRYTTREGRAITTTMSKRRSENMAEGDRIEVLYDPDDPDKVQRHQRLGSAPAVVVSFAAGAAVLGALAYRTRKEPAD